MTFNDILNSRWTIPVVCGVTGAAAGFAAGYIYAQRKEEYYEYKTEDAVVKEEPMVDDSVYGQDPVLQEEVPTDEDGRTYADTVREQEEALRRGLEADASGFGPPRPFHDYRDIISQEGYVPAKEVSDISEDEEEGKAMPSVAHNVFTDAPPEDEVLPFSEEWDFDEMEEYREVNNDGPYPLHVTEFLRNDLSYHQDTLIYYAKDDILADENDKPIYNYRSLTGPLYFGYGSEQENVYYVRNAGIRREWEIMRENSSFAEVVHGLEVEGRYEEMDLKHSSTPRKFRTED